jgi:membrane-bound ClpP family serine protease
MTVAQRIGKWSWILIYVGMVLLALGLSAQRSDAALGWGIAGLGIAMMVIGVVLVWIRSRMKNTQENP